MKKILPVLLTVLGMAACADKPSGFVRPYDCIDTRVGTAASTTRTAGLFGKGSEEYGQTLPAVLEPNGMNFWTPQTRDTEQKCVAPYYYADTLLQGFRASHWIVLRLDDADAAARHAAHPAGESRRCVRP